MNTAEVLQLCRLVKACCPSQVFDAYTPDAWALILGGYDYDDAKRAVAEMVSAPLDPGKARYIEPGHIIGGIGRIRRQRLEGAMPEPPSGLGTDDYLAWLRTTRAAVASGTYVPTAVVEQARPELVAQVRAIAASLSIGTDERITA